MMEEWQRRQRAEKEKDRQQKQASAELLSGYRAAELDAEALKLKELREQERLQRQQAEATLRNFKKLEEPLHKAKNTTTDNDTDGLPVPVNAGGSHHNDDDDITFGSVSALKANFNDSFTPPSQMEAPRVPDGTPTVLPSGEALVTAAASTVIPDNLLVDETSTPALTVPPLEAATNEYVNPITTPGTADTAELTTGAAAAWAQPPPVTFSFGIITDNNNNNNGATSNDDGRNIAQAYQQGLASLLQVSANTVQLRSVTRDMSYPHPLVRYVVEVETAGIGLEASVVHETVRSTVENGKLWEASRPYKTA